MTCQKWNLNVVSHFNTPSQQGIIPPASCPEYPFNKSYPVSSISSSHIVIDNLNLSLSYSFLCLDFPSHMLNIIESKRRIILTSKGSSTCHPLSIGEPLLPPRISASREPNATTQETLARS